MRTKLGGTIFSDKPISHHLIHTPFVSFCTVLQQNPAVVLTEILIKPDKAATSLNSRADPKNTNQESLLMSIVCPHTSITCKNYLVRIRLPGSWLPNPSAPPKKQGLAKHGETWAGALSGWNHPWTPHQQKNPEIFGAWDCQELSRRVLYVLFDYDAIGSFGHVWCKMFSSRKEIRAQNRMARGPQAGFTSNIRLTLGNQEMNAQHNTKPHRHRFVLVSIVISGSTSLANQHDIEHHWVHVRCDSMELYN